MTRRKKVDDKDYLPLTLFLRPKKKRELKMENVITEGFLEEGKEERKEEVQDEKKVIASWGGIEVKGTTKNEFDFMKDIYEDMEKDEGYEEK